MWALNALKECLCKREADKSFSHKWKESSVSNKADTGVVQTPAQEGQYRCEAGRGEEQISP